jgi:HEAT repeat protein/beta-lactamase regulating signal transducer with metallopeptidase domain
VANTWATIKGLHWSVLLTGIWLLGVLGIMGNHFVGALGLYLVARRARPIQSQEWQDLADEIGDRLWITRDVTLLKSHATTMPVTWGGRKPVVLLPSDADTWTDERRRYVLTHEFAHIRRWDCTTQGIAQLACALYWFNPMVWVAARRLRIERERACDDQVLMSGGKASSYAEHLLDIARSLRATLVSPLGAVAMARPSQLEGRVLAILDPDRRRRAFSKGQSMTAMALAVLVIVPIAAMAPATDSIESAWSANKASQDPGLVTEVAAPELAANAESVTDMTALVESAKPMDAFAAAATETAAGLAETVSRGMLPKVAARRPQVAIPDTIDTRKRKVVDAFIGALDDEDEQIRRQAAHMLGEIEDERAIPALKETLKNDDSREVRRAALWALSEMDTDEIMPVLLDLAADETDDEARRQLAWMIGENADRGDRRAGEVLIKLLKDGDAEVRATAVWALAEMEYVPALDAIVSMTEDSNDEVRERAVWAIAELAEEAPSDQAVEALARAMSSSNAQVRETAAWGLGELEDPRAVDVLIRAMGDSDPEVRKKVIWALGEIEDPRAVTVLSNALKDGNKEVRRRAANALHEIDTEASHRALGAAVGDADVQVRRLAVYALSELEDPASIGVLEQAAQDSDKGLRRAAIHALADMEDPRAAAALVSALSDDDASIRKYAAHGLSELDSTPAIVSGLRKALGDSNAEVRRAVIHTLAELEDYASADALIDALNDESAENRRAAAWAVAELLEDRPTGKGVDALAAMLRNDSSAENRKTAAYALGELGSGRAIDVLRQALDDGNRDVRRAAANALSDIDWDEDDADWDDDEDWDDNQNDDWDDDQANFEGIRIDLSDQQFAQVGEALGLAVGDITEIALDAAGAAIQSIDLGSIFHSIRHDIGDMDLDAMVDEFEAGIEGVDTEIEMQIRGAMISGLASLAMSDPESADSRAAIRALKRMDHKEARKALEKIDDCGC